MHREKLNKTTLALKSPYGASNQTVVHSKFKAEQPHTSPPFLTTNHNQCIYFTVVHPWHASTVAELQQPEQKITPSLKEDKEEIELTVFGPIPLNGESSFFTSSTDSSRRYSRQILPLRSLTSLSMARILAAFVAAKPPHLMASSSLFPSSSTTSGTKQIGREGRE